MRECRCQVFASISCRARFDCPNEWSALAQHSAINATDQRGFNLPERNLSMSTWKQRCSSCKVGCHSEGGKMLGKAVTPLPTLPAPESVPIGSRREYRLARAPDRPEKESVV